MIRTLMIVVISCILAGLPAHSLSALEIHVGHVLLAPNQAGQTLEVTVTGGEMVAGVNLYAQIGDGGPELADVGLPPGHDGPAITTVDLKTASVFSGVPDPAINQGGLPQVAIWSLGIAAPGGTVPAQGKLASLTIDTTGFAAGRWDVKLSDVLAGLDGGPFATDFAGLEAAITNGSIRINAGRTGDTDADGDVDLADLNNVRNQFGAEGGNPIGDTFPFNGVVNLEDLNAVRNNFGATVASAVPEPGTLLLGVVGALVLIAQRRHTLRK